MRARVLIALAATLIACGSDKGSTDTETSASLPDAEDCTGTLTGGPRPGALTCRIQLSYSSDPRDVAASEGDTTMLTVLGSLKEGGGTFSQNLVIPGQPRVGTFDELVFEQRQGVAQRGTVGSASFNGGRGLISQDRASVSLTAVEANPEVPSVLMVSGSAEWDLSFLGEGAPEATIAITFRDQ